MYLGRWTQMANNIVKGKKWGKADRFSYTCENIRFSKFFEKTIFSFHKFIIIHHTFSKIYWIIFGWYWWKLGKYQKLIYCEIRNVAAVSKKIVKVDGTFN